MLNKAVDIHNDNQQYALLFKNSCFLESSLPGKVHPSTPVMYKFRPSFGTMPKVHYHATGEKV